MLHDYYELHRHLDTERINYSYFVLHIDNFGQLSGGSMEIVVISPDGSQQLMAGSTYDITWETYDVGPLVTIQYSSNNGSSWNSMGPATPNDGSYEWTVPEITSDQCLIKVSDDAATSDTSDSVFTIFQCDGPVPGDFNNDCYVTVADFAIFSLYYMTNGNPLDP